MKLRQLQPSDVLEIGPWYEEKGDFLNEEWIPKGTAFVVEDAKSDLIACGFLLLTNSGIAFMEFLATNPKKSELEQGKALRFLTLELEKLSKQLGFQVILGFVPEDHFSLVKHYQRQKAFMGKKLMRLFWKPL